MLSKKERKFIKGICNKLLNSTPEYESFYCNGQKFELKLDNITISIYRSFYDPPTLSLHDSDNDKRLYFFNTFQISRTLNKLIKKNNYERKIKQLNERLLLIDHFYLMLKEQI